MSSFDADAPMINRLGSDFCECVAYRMRRQNENEAIVKIRADRREGRGGEKYFILPLKALFLPLRDLFFPEDFILPGSNPWLWAPGVPLTPGL